MEDIPTIIVLLNINNARLIKKYLNISFATLIATFQLLHICKSVVNTVVIMFYFHAQMAFGIIRSH